MSRPLKTQHLISLLLCHIIIVFIFHSPGAWTSMFVLTSHQWAFIVHSRSWRGRCRLEADTQALLRLAKDRPRWLTLSSVKSLGSSLPLCTCGNWEGEQDRHKEKRGMKTEVKKKNLYSVAQWPVIFRLTLPAILTLTSNKFYIDTHLFVFLANLLSFFNLVMWDMYIESVYINIASLMRYWRLGARLSCCRL